MATDAEISAEARQSPAQGDVEKDEANVHGVDPIDELKQDMDLEYKQEGVKQVEAVTQVFSKKVVFLTLVFIYLISFAAAMQQSVQQNLTPYITSSFSAHGLLATTNIVSTIIGGVSKLTIAKIIDIWGRVEGFCFMLLLITVGLIMKAVCQNVETYAAAQTLYWVGHLGLLYIVDVVVADMTTLKNRMIIFGINATPTIATVFAGSKIAQLYYDHLNFRWAFGSWAIILVGICIPIIGIVVYHEKKAKKFGLYPEKPKDRTWWQACKHYVVEFDVVGLILTSAGFSLILLPFSLATSAPNGWRSGYVIAMLVLGAVCLAAFVVWEKYFAPIQYLPWKFLKDRNIMAGCLVYGFMFISI
ncbi:hypothetical protein Plec18167_007802 [Paecilomyces lecythidis]|uniref:Siderophore iron transporter mirB n=1 Tax=Paecilomyces lecythidis TaxID=3004212 RepID=A0ABR3X132_9EURO